MGLRLLHSLRVTAIALALLASGFVFMANPAAAQGTTQITIGLQNDMTDMNQWNPATNTVWKTYQIGDRNFESLLGTDLNGNLFPYLADPARGGGAGYTVLTPIAPDAATVDVFIRPGVTFTDGTPMTADDVIFSYQVQGWGTYASFIGEALWWDEPRFAHWTGGGAMSHYGVEKIGADTVRFHLRQTYALFFVATLSVLIMPKHIWTAHIDPVPPRNYTNPAQPITDSADRSMDFAFGTGGIADIAATIGTGPWKLTSWVRNQGATSVVSDTYWGKGVPSASVLTGSTRYNFLPDHLRSIRFVIYSSLDVISLALQSGEIDTLIWSLLPGFLSQVRFNPAISVEQVTDSGMFYLSFNLRRKPWNDLDLRKAVSMAIDKDYIVNVLMGGFGIKGTVPHSIVRSEYTNSSAVPPAFDLAGARAFLDSVNIVDINGDGFREYKDGTPIRTSILTPPKDYDPVRADAGIMIANNLKKIGLNIDSAPTSFDTIVAKAFLPPVDFDIYILGFLLGTLPEGYLKDFFHSSQDVNINPAGSNSAGYRNPTVDAQLDQALITLDNNQRIQLIKDIVGKVVADIPWNILYYRKNLNAYRNDRWVGWVNTPPQLYNFWSVSKLSPPGQRVITPIEGAIRVALTLPERAIGGRTIPVDVFVSQNNAPASGASVTVNATFGTQFREVTGTTDVSGHVRFSWRVPVIQGELVVKATATKGTVTGSATKLMQVVVGPPAPMATLRLSTTRPVIGVGQTTDILARMIDGAGVGVAGAPIRVDTTLVFGSISPAQGVTDATGSLTFRYTAPADASGFPNQHLTEFLKFFSNVPDTVAVDTQSQSIVVYVQNDVAPSWLIADVEATDLILNTAILDDSTSIGVRVTDFSGAAQSGVVVEPVLPESEAGIANVTVSPATATDASGLATFTVTKTAGAAMGNVPIRFRATGTAYQASDVAGLLITDGVAPGFAALVDFADRSVTTAPTRQSTTITATVWNQLGLMNPLDAAVIYQITSGDVGMQAQFPWAFDGTTGRYLDQGLDFAHFDYGGSFGPSFENSTGQGSSYGVDNAVGDFEILDYTGVDSCDDTTWPADFLGYYILNATGQLTGTVRPAPHKIDSVIQVRAFIGSTLPTSRLHLNVTACSGDPATFFGWGVTSQKAGRWVPGVENAAFMLDSGMIAQRAPVFALGSVSVGTGGEIFTSAERTRTVTATFYDLNGPAQDAKVFLTRGAGTAARNVRGAVGGTIATNTAGQLTWDATVPLLSLSQPHFFGFLTFDERYAYGGGNELLASVFGPEYYLNQFLFAPLAKIPMEFASGYLFIPANVVFVTAAVDKMLVAEGGTAKVTITVRTGTDAPVANATVWSGPFTALTDQNGAANFTFGSSLGATENLAVVQTTDGEVVRAWYGVQASRPVLTYSGLSVTAAEAGKPSKVTLTATNALTVAGPATVTLLVGGQPVASRVVDFTGGEAKTVTFDHVFAAAGDYTVAVGDQSTSTAIRPAAGLGFVETYGLGLGLLVAGLVVGAVVGLLMSRRRKPPTGAEMRPSEQEEL